MSALHGDPPFSQLICKRCQVIGSDLKILDCGCTLHARCTPVQVDSPLSSCPGCGKACRSIYLMPMSFTELDEACKTAATMAAGTSSRREKKRKSATIARLNPEVASQQQGASADAETSSPQDDLRTGRWTNDEMQYCDKLIQHFCAGELPVAEGVKLNDFLANMLKSKQSRLTKKMKNAKLSTNVYKQQAGYIVDMTQATAFSTLENEFFESISCTMERAEVRFHLQKEWRELFSSFCVDRGQNVVADEWLTSVEEMDRRASRAKDAARMTRRKRMMGYALQRDALNPANGIFIETKPPLNPNAPTTTTDSSSLAISGEADDVVMAQRMKKHKGGGLVLWRRTNRPPPPPFLGKVVSYLQRHSVPFEYVDAWVPSFVNAEAGKDGGQRCRLCFAGCATTDTEVTPDNRGSAPLTKDVLFDMNSFGDYSSKFSFDVGCGLPGRVYQSGCPSWERSVQNAPLGHFERGGGAIQWGIKTVVGIPIPSPNVGRIVVLFYSRQDRPQNADLVGRIVDEMTRLMPAPKWKLVVDIGGDSSVSQPESTAAASETATAAKQQQEQQSQIDGKPESNSGKDDAANELLRLLTEFMPTNAASPLAPYISSITSLRMMLLKPSKTPPETELITCIVQSYSSYMSTGRARSDIAMLVVRDFIALAPRAAPTHPTQQIPMRQQQASTVAHMGGAQTGLRAQQYAAPNQHQVQHQQQQQQQHLVSFPPQQQQHHQMPQHQFAQQQQQQQQALHHQLAQQLLHGKVTQYTHSPTLNSAISLSAVEPTPVSLMGVPTPQQQQISPNHRQPALLAPTPPNHQQQTTTGGQYPTAPTVHPSVPGGTAPGASAGSNSQQQPTTFSL